MNINFFGDLAAHADEKSIYKTRRTELISAIKQHYPDKTGAVVLFAAFETGPERFRQDKTFFYYTGINEPGTVLVIEMDGKSTLYAPYCFKKRAQWLHIPPAFLQEDAKALGVDAFTFLGHECEDYTLNSYFLEHEYENMIIFLKTLFKRNGTMFTTLPHNGYEYLTTRLVINHLQSFIPEIQQYIIDISKIIATNRRRKDISEIEKIYRAIEVTELAHEAAIQAIKNEISESEVQASLEYMMIAAHARPAFPSIVASGKNATILHYTENNGIIKNGNLVLIDIGAELHNYCADLTRTYPVSGTFTKRQKDLYTIVLETQEYIAELAKPGMWLKNSKNPEKSLHHLAHAFLKKHGYDNCFPHSIGHFLGLDVHDVGDYSVPLHEGDVITIEPGIYIPEEGIGIRIEDNYWITKNGAFCLSEHLPKTADEIEKIMKQALTDESEQDIEIEEEYFDDNFSSQA